MSDLTQTRKTIGSELAARMIVAAEAKALEIGVPCVVAITDDAGTLKMLSRMDGAPLVSVQVAQDKAYTAAGFGLSTDQWFEFIKSDEPLRLGAVGGIDRLIVFGGGFPISIGGEVVGAIGVSGGHYSQDMEIANTGLSVVEAAFA